MSRSAVFAFFKLVVLALLPALVLLASCYDMTPVPASPGVVECPSVDTPDACLDDAALDSVEGGDDALDAGLDDGS